MVAHAVGMTTSTDALPTGSRAEAGKKRATLKPARPMFRMIVEAATVLATIAVQSRAFLVAPLGRGVRLGAPQLAPGASYSSVVRMAYNFERSPNTWKDDEGDIEPGFGGVWPGDPNAKTHNVRQSSVAVCCLTTLYLCCHVAARYPACINKQTSWRC